MLYNTEISEDTIWFGIPTQGIFVLSNNILILPMSPINYHGLTLFIACLNNAMHYEVKDEITYPLSHIKDATVSVWEWISNWHITGHVITYACGNKS